MMNDNNLKELRATIEELMEEDNQEDENMEIPEALDQKVRLMLQAVDKKEEGKKKKQNRRRRFQIVAASLICVLTIGTVTVTNVDAVKKEFLKIFTNEQEGSITFRTDEEEKIIGDWDNYWYPGYLPEGYFLLDAEEDNTNNRIMLFIQDGSDCEIRIMEDSANSPMTFDTDHHEMEQVELNNNEGYLFYDKENKNISLYWKTVSKALTVDISNSSDKDMAVKIAKGMELVKKK